MLLTTMHPTYAFFHQPYEWGTFEGDLKRLGRMVRGELEALPPAPNINATHHDLADLLREVAAFPDPWVAVDIETAPCNSAEPWTGKQPTRALLKSIAFGTTTRSVAFWWAEADDITKLMIKEVLADDALTKVFHNGWWFDVPVLARFGMQCHNVVDTRDARRALSSTSRLSLRHLGRLYTDFWNWKSRGDDEEKTTIDEQLDEDGEEVEDPAEADEAFGHESWQARSRDELLTYNGYDTVVTARVHRGILGDWPKDVSESARVQALYEQHTELAKLAAEMHQTGMYVRKDWRGFMLSCCEQRIAETRERVIELAATKGFEPTPNKMRALIFKKHATAELSRWNLPDPYDKKAYTKTGLCAVNAKALLLLLVSGMCPPDLEVLIEAWWDYAEATKRQGYLASHLLDQAMGPDGRVRAGHNSCGTDTGRFSCNQPNILNVEHMLRAMFGPPEGRALVHGDKAQLELRVGALIAANSFMVDALNSGDVYSFQARDWFNLPADANVKKDYPGLRQSSKVIQLARQYGASINTVFREAVAASRKFTLSKVQTLVMQWDKSNFRMVQYWGEEMQRVMQSGYSESRIMRRRRTYPRPPERSEVANWPVQASAADLMNCEILELWGRLKREVPDAKIVCFLYDAVDVECRIEDVERVKKVMADVSNRSWRMDGREMDFPMDFKVASWPQTWAEVA